MLISRAPRPFFLTFHLILFSFVRINFHTYLWNKALPLCLPEIFFNLVLNRKLIVLCLILLGMQLSRSIVVHLEPWTVEIKQNMYMLIDPFLLPNSIFCLLRTWGCWVWVLPTLQNQIFIVCQSGTENMRNFFLIGMNF